MTFQAILDEVQNNLCKILSDLSVSVVFSVEPAKSGFDDVSSNISFLLAKQLKKSPQEIAQMISQKYQQLPHTLVLESKPHPSGYINFVADWKKLSQLILSESFLPESGCIDLGGGSTVVVEHTSVNPNKALHIGHVRNIIIGDTLSRILKKANYKVNVLNYVDDLGVQVADIIVGFKYFGFDLEPPDGKKFDHYCGDDVYVKTTLKYDDDPDLKKFQKTILQELEDYTSETAKFGEKVTRRVLSDQLKTCWNLGVTYDCLNFESQIIRSGMWLDVFEKLKKMNLIELESEGENKDCWVFRMGGKEKDKVIVRSNGTATYIAKDIPYAAWKLGLLKDPFYYTKYEKEQPHKTLWQTTLEKGDKSQNFAGQKVITVIDSRQALLQKIITSMMSKFKSSVDSYIHLGYESVTLGSDTAKSLGLESEQKQVQMSGRRGTYVSADSVYSLLKDKVADETKNRHPQMTDSETQTISHHVAVGTLRYEMIKQDLDKIITFDLAKSLSLEGDTAPYIQYTHARACRILEKSSQDVSIDVDFTLLQDKHEIDLIKMIGLFGIAVYDAAKNYSPKVISRYCRDLAVAFNSFYEKSKVLDLDDKDLEKSRLCLVNSFKMSIEKSLGLLGIVAPEKM